MKTLFVITILLFCTFCKKEEEAGSKSTPKRTFSLAQKTTEIEETPPGCLIESLSITIEGLKENELIQSRRSKPLQLPNQKCKAGFFFSLGGDLELPLEDDLFSKSELSLEEKTVTYENTGLRVGDVEAIYLRKAGFCIKNYESKEPCEGRASEECLYYEAYEEDLYTINFLSVSVNGIEIYNSEVELIFSREYELTWSDADLLSAFWTKLQDKDTCSL